MAVVMPIKDDHLCSVSSSSSLPEPSPPPAPRPLVAEGVARTLVHVGRVDSVKDNLIVAASIPKKKDKKRRRKIV
jgi:hypothetical protein